MVSNFERSITIKYVRAGKKNECDYKVVTEILTEYELIVDSCEQTRERPGENQEQKKYYSGKKKSHTFKNQLIVLPLGKDIVDVIAGKLGPSSDISLFKEQQKGFEAQQKFKGDKGYVGASSMRTPQKKQRNQELTFEQKQRNQELSSARIFVEHIIRLLKIFRVAQERFRLNPQKYEQIILTICGLVRLRIGGLIL